jgi:hypothetical protein
MGLWLPRYSRMVSSSGPGPSGAALTQRSIGSLAAQMASAAA